MFRVHRLPPHAAAFWLLLAALPLNSSADGGNSRSTTFTVRTTVVASCSVSADALNFGTTVPTPITNPVDATTTISAICSINTPYFVALDAGTGQGATTRVRRMSGTGGSIEYGIFTDAGRTSPWGDGANGTVRRESTGTGQPQSLTVYGRIPGGQSPAAGTYTDQITVTVLF
jgi:spore coat protein U-like protein